MWSIVFTLMVGSYLVLGPTMLLHVLFLIGIYFTSTVYKNLKISKLIIRYRFFNNYIRIFNVFRP